MRNTIVGLFDSRAEADRARADLIQGGFSDSDIRVVAQDSSAARTQTAGSTTSTNTGDRSFWDEVKDFFGFGDEDADAYEYEEGVRRGGVLVAVSASEDRIDQATNIILKHNPIDLEKRAEEWRASGWQGTGASAAPRAATAVPTAGASSSNMTSQSRTAASASTTRPAATARTAESGEKTIPVVEEQLQVGKRAVQRGVRIFQHVTERPVQEQVQLRDERVVVERRPVDRPVTDAAGAFQDRTIEVTETHEQPVVSKQAHVVEEVVVGRQATEHTETVRDKVRRTEVDVEQAGQSGRSGSDINDPATQFANELVADQRYRGRDWDSVESDARQSYERSHPGSKWEQIKDSVRNAYDRARSKV